MRRKVLARGDEEEGRPYNRGCGGLKHSQLLAVPHKQGRERGERAGDQAVYTTAELGYETQDSPDHKNADQDAEESKGGVTFGGAKPAEERLPVVERQVVGRRMLVAAEMEGVLPDVSGVGSGPFERDGFVEPDAVVFKPPETRQGSQEKNEQFG